MSHEVETMAYTNEVPWHGLGVKIDKAANVKEMIKLAKLDWKVERRPLMFGKYTKDGKPSFTDGSIVGDFAALARNTDDAVLDIVGKKYVPTQNDEAFEFFNEYVERGDATMETAGSLRGGRYVWGLARLKKDFKLPGNDVIKGYLLVACLHQQGKSLLMKTTAVRVVCNNTLTLALREKGSEFRMVHRRAFDAGMVAEAKKTLGLAREQIDEFEQTARKLKKMTMNDREVLEILGKVYQDDGEKLTSEDKASRTVKQLLDIYRRAPGADPGNGWGVLNSVTYYADHVASRTADKRLSNAWFGKTANQKQKVLDLLLA